MLEHLNERLLPSRGQQTLSHVLYKHAVLGVGNGRALEVFPSGILGFGQDAIELGHYTAPRQGDETLLHQLILLEERRDGGLPIRLQLVV